MMIKHGHEIFVDEATGKKNLFLAGAAEAVMTISH